VCPAQHIRVFHGLHGFLELVHLILLISQKVVHILAIESVSRSWREFLYFLLVLVVWLRGQLHVVP